MNRSLRDGLRSGLGISGRTVAAVFTKSLREANVSASGLEYLSPGRFYFSLSPLRERTDPDPVGTANDLSRAEELLDPQRCEVELARFPRPPGRERVQVADIYPPRWPRAARGPERVAPEVVGVELHGPRPLVIMEHCLSVAALLPRMPVLPHLPVAVGSGASHPP